jgi:Raf kinase inhibitor-like YbhB/YbcL family protein
MHSPGSTVGPFTLTSPEFAEGGRIPRRFSCDGDDVSPPLSWRGLPDGAVSLALVVDDPDANGFVHWLAYNIDASKTGSLPAGWSGQPDAAAQGTNGFGRLGYGGPCPPSGEHRYRFRLLALDTLLELPHGPRAADLLAATEGHVLGEARLTASYRRGG